MTKNEFLMSLRTRLTQLGVLDVGSIISDYEEHFAHGTSSGKSDSDVIAKLGSIEQIAKAYETENFANKIKSQPKSTDLFSVLGRALVLTPLNFFVLIGPVIFILAMLFSGWCVAGAFGIVSFVGLTAGFWFAPLVAFGIWNALGVFFLALGFLSFSAIGLMLMVLITQGVVQLFASYLRWNVQFLLNKQEI